MTQRSPHSREGSRPRNPAEAAANLLATAEPGGAAHSLALRESPQSRFERIYREVRERICLLRYPPGTVLGESQLAEEFGVSRTPIRRVLLRLSFDGLVDIKNGVGNIVTQIDLKTFKEISDLRMGLADLMGRLSSGPIRQIEVKRVERLLKRTRALRRGPNYEEYAQISNELAEALLALIGNRPLREMTDILHYRVARTWFSLLPSLDWTSVTDTLEEEITQTLEAMKSGDIAAVGSIRRKFLGRTLAAISEYLSGP